MARPNDVRNPRPVTDHPADAGLRRARASRDAGLRRASRLTGWIIAGTIALTGALSEVAAHAFPGHRKRVASSSPQPRPTGQPVPAPSTGEGDSAAPDIQPPEQAPAPSDATGGAVSGGS